MGENNNDFVFCLMENKVLSKTTDLNNQCSYFVGDLHRNCMDYMNSPVVNNDLSIQFGLSEEITSKWSTFIDYIIEYKKVYHS